MVSCAELVKQQMLRQQKGLSSVDFATCAAVDTNPEQPAPLEPCPHHDWLGASEARRHPRRCGTIRTGLAGIGRIGARLRLTTLLTLLAEAQSLDGAIAEAVSTAQDALQVNPQEIVFRPQILALRGELLLKLNQPKPAETDLREAIAREQKMRARVWVLCINEPGPDAGDAWRHR